MCGGLRKPGWSRKKSFHVKWLNVKFFPYVSDYLSNFWKFIKNQRVKRFVKNKKHVIKYEQGKPKQKLTQFFYFSTSAWFPQTATHISNNKTCNNSAKTLPVGLIHQSDPLWSYPHQWQTSWDAIGRVTHWWGDRSVDKIKAIFDI